MSIHTTHPSIQFIHPYNSSIHTGFVVSWGKIKMLEKASLYNNNYLLYMIRVLLSNIRKNHHNIV